MMIIRRMKTIEARIGPSVTMALLLVTACFVSGQSIASDAAVIAPLQLPPFKVGEVITFSYETKVHNGTASVSEIDSSLSETFDVKVLSVAPTDVRIDWTLRNAIGTGVYQRAMAFYAAFKGVPVEVQTDPAGIPQDIANWDRIKDHYFAGAMDDNARNQARQAGEQFQKASASLLFSQILVTIAAMQPREPIAFGHTVLDSPIKNAPPPSPQFSVSRSIDYLGSEPAQCSAKIARKTTQVVQIDGKTEPTQTLETIADVSTKDGWIIDLHETRPGDLNFSETTNIRRNEPNPC